MLDRFLEVALAQHQKNDARQQMVDGFMHLPNEELHKIANGQFKLADYDGEGDWLEKFQGTPFYDQALALEEECLQLQIHDQQQRLAERRDKDEERNAIWDAQDTIRLKKRMLELELRKGQHGGAVGEGGEVEESEPSPSDVPMAAPAPGPEKMAAVDSIYAKRMAAIHHLGEMMKEAKELTLAGREKIKPKNFAIPKGNGPGDTGKYPIQDTEHAGNALTRVRQFGTSAEKAKVYSAVVKKYPELAARSSVEKVQAKAKDKEKDSCSEMKTSASWEETSPYFWGHSMLNPLPGSGYGAAAGGLMADPESTSPVLRGALAGGLTGGAIYGLKGLSTGDPRVAGLAALIGGAGGAVGGAHASHAITQKAKAKDKKEGARLKKESAAAKAMISSMFQTAQSAIEKCASDQLSALDDLEVYAIAEMVKAAEVRVQAGISIDDLEDFEKVAIWSAIKAGLSGAKGFLGKGVSSLKAAPASARLSALKNIGTEGAQQATSWAAKNPGAAAALGGGALLGAGGLGYAAG